MAQDGQVFAFGDATFLRAQDRAAPDRADSRHCRDRDGQGYWLVAQNGAMFTFGDAVAHSSAQTVHSTPVVGIAADTATTGYWLVGADGTVSGFDAPGFGSIAGYGIADAITGIEALPGGRRLPAGRHGGRAVFLRVGDGPRYGQYGPPRECGRRHRGAVTTSSVQPGGRRRSTSSQVGRR